MTCTYAHSCYLHLYITWNMWLVAFFSLLALSSSMNHFTSFSKFQFSIITNHSEEKRTTLAEIHCKMPLYATIRVKADHFEAKMLQDTLQILSVELLGEVADELSSNREIDWAWFYFHWWILLRHEISDKSSHILSLLKIEELIPAPENLCWRLPFYPQTVRRHSMVIGLIHRSCRIRSIWISGFRFSRFW